MRELAERLIDLQELEIVHQESTILHKDNPPDELQELRQRIDVLRARIPSSTLARYDGHRRTGLGVVREIGGICRGCYLNITVGDLGRMRREEVPWICPNCGRLLLVTGKA